MVLGGHGLFTWGATQRECYVNTITIIDQLGQFVVGHVEKLGERIFGGARAKTLANHREIALDLFPLIRGRVSGKQRLIGNFNDLPEVLRFVNSADAETLARLGTSCPDHFIRTKIRPLFVRWDGNGGVASFQAAFDSALDQYRRDYEKYYSAFAVADSPKIRDANPTVVLVPGVGMFSFGKNKTEARITGEFYTNAVHVMEGATALGASSDGQCEAERAASGGTRREDGSVRSAFELRRAAAVGSVSHRVLGAGRSEDSPSAAGKRIEPADLSRRRRGEWNRARDGAACGSARRSRDRCG